ncbi:MAG: OmpA family protein [Bacteroidales bacterium]|nr:OmpA family protein [Bacteroidales bacterium]
MRNIKYIVLSTFAIAVLFSACVPLQKYRATESELQQANQQLNRIKTENEQYKVENAELKIQLQRNEARMSAMVKDSMQRAQELQRLARSFDSLYAEHSSLQDAHELLLKGAQKESARLMRQLQETQEELRKKEASLSALEKSLNEKRINLERMTAELNKRDARLKELESILFKKDSVVRALRNVVSDALLGFEGEGLSVDIRNGKVYVSLEEKLLFPSGSTSVNPRGKEALRKLAQVLERNPDINITIEGHTDNVPYKSRGEIKDNWDLSVMRATSIIRILLENSTIDPKRLTAAGKGEFMPIASNKTTDGRAKNRRTEIILTPKLDELFKILE